jgi:hypothetical protein
MFEPHVEPQLENLNPVPCSSIDLLLTHLDHTRFQVSTVIFLRIQLAKARLPLGVTWGLTCVTKSLQTQRRTFTVPHKWLTYLSSSTWLLSWDSTPVLPYVSACCKEWDFLRGRDVCIVGVDLETETTNYNDIITKWRSLGTILNTTSQTTICYRPPQLSPHCLQLTTKISSPVKD